MGARQYQYKVIELVCDTPSCRNSIEGKSYDLLVEKGWRTFEGDWFCPACSAKKAER